MRVQIGVLLAAICVSICSVAGASEIGLSPSRITVGEVETFLSIRGTDIRGNESTEIVFRGPGGEFVLAPSTLDDPSLVIVWIPIDVAINEGVYSVEVLAKDFNLPVRVHGPATFVVAPQEEVVAPPLLGLPELVYAEATSIRGAEVEFEVNAISQGGTGLVVVCSSQSGSHFPIGRTSVSCTATDSGGSVTGDFDVFVADVGVPVVTVPDDIVSATPNVNFTVTAVDSVDGNVPVVCSPSSGAMFPKGTTVVQCIAYDSHLNPGYGSFNVTVTNGAPILSLPEDIFAQATSPAGAVVTYVATSDDSPVTCTPASGSQFPMGQTIVNCSATNAFGTTSGMFVVSVDDTAGPVLALPTEVNAEATSASGAVVTYTATATDAVDGPVAIECTPASGSHFAMGATEVTCSASDLQGIITTGTFTVNVRDTTPPTVVSISVTPNQIWPPNHKMVPVQVSIVAVDSVSANPTSMITSITSNQPQNGLGDGDTGPFDWTILGALNAEVRSERIGTNDRVYTIVVETRDEAGNVTQSSVQVRVSQSRARAIR
jgi:hypothetical protein